MDQLLHHCLRELSFDGDLGCDVLRLNDFVAGFYTPERGESQNLDPTFCSFVWSLIVQHPTVVVGLLPQGVTSEVWVAPQTSAKRKAKASGKEHVETQPSQLEIIPNAKNIPLQDLAQTYGDRLRIAVEPAAIFAAITGSHIRSSRMSPMVYSALQIITRGRDEGVTVVQLGQQSKYDQKTCFYLVKQLTEMDLVVKVRRGGVGTHFCIHKYFYDRSPSWQAIREEETRAEEAAQLKDEPSVDTAGLEETNGAAALHFTPIDSRHLSSLPLVKARVVKLLKASHSHIHAGNNLLITIGFSNPTKTDRRFFQSRIRELIQQGVIEKVIVPNRRKNANSGSTVKCFRLVDESAGQNDQENGVVVQDDDGKDDDIADEDSGVKANMTIHKQIIDLLEESGTVGMTLNELSTALGNFDKRTIELFLARADKSHPPPHLADLGVAGLMETSGRERRHRYYTVAAYRELVAAEQLDKSSAGFGDIDTDQAGGFGSFAESLFFSEASDLIRFEDTFHRATAKPTKKVYKNPILPDGTVKKGRPRKHPVDEDSRRASGTQSKRKRDAADTAEEPQAPKKRGRPRKVQPEKVEGGDDPASASLPKKRGRPPKRKADVAEDDPPPTTRAKRTRVGKQTPDPTADSTPALDNQDQRALKSTKDTPVDESPDLNHDAETGREDAPAAGESSDPTSGPGESPLVGSAGQAEPRRSPAISAAPEVMEVDARPNEADEVAKPTSTSSQRPPSPSSGTSPPEVNPQEPAGALLRFETPPSDIPMPVMPEEPASKTSVAKAVRGRVNVSHLRRENELIRLLEEAGGIMNTQTKEFFDAHTALIDSLSKAGEPTSAPAGTRTDKRTAALTIESLESKGKLKQLKTSVTTHTGVNKPATIIYLPSVEQERLNAFLADVSRGVQPSIPSSGSAVKIQEAVPYGADPAVSTRGILPLQLLQLEQPGENKKERWSKNATRANQLFSYDDATIRDVLLAERTTQGQLYGFIVGKAARARSFYLTTFEKLLSATNLPSIIPGSRIIDLAYFNNELPVGLFTAYASVLSHSEQLTQLYSTEEGRNTPVKNLPSDLHTMLQVGRSRARTRILDIMELLQSLKLVTPLKPATSPQPWITAPPHGHHPVAFDIAFDQAWSPSTPHAAPSYWYFNAEAPLYLWSVSDSNPPYWKTVPTLSLDDAREYWRLLRDASLDPYLPRSIAMDQPAGTMAPALGAARTLRRPVSWNADYVLTWHQQKFLEKSIDLVSGATPLDDENRETRNGKLMRLCWVTSAPQQAVESFLRSARVKVANDKSKLRNEGKEMKRLKKLDDAKVALAKKAEEAKAAREQQWASLLASVHPDDLGPATSRVERVHARFMQAGTVKDLGKWEKEVLDAVREVNLASTKILRAPAKRPPVQHRPAPGPSTLAALDTENPSATVLSIKALIEQQQPLLDQGLFKRKPKNKKKAQEVEPAEPKKSVRRHRFQWNKEYDELARDASVIIRARCRAHARLDWAALEQVFPAVPRNTVRQRLAHIRESPGNDSYLRRLEDRWYGLWEKFRGTDALPDEHPESTSDFNLIQHIEFLRQNVDKNALRVGFGQEKESITTIIPKDVDTLLQKFNIVEENPSAPPWDFVWNAVVEEGREKRLLSQCFTAELGNALYEKSDVPDGHALAEAALKMTMGSPPESYNCDSASALLFSVGEDAVSKATLRLLGKGVLSKSQRDPSKQRPGRQLKISDSNQNAMGGPIPRDTYSDAISLLESAQVSDSAWREWPLTATDGDMVGLIHLVSEEQVEFKVNTSDAQAARPALDWNSKRADDDQIETAITVKYSQPLPTNGEIPMNWGSPAAGDIDLNEPSSSGVIIDAHGRTSAGDAACCQRTCKSDSPIIDCAVCLEDGWAAVKSTLTPEERMVADALLSKLRGLGGTGCEKQEVKAISSNQSLLQRVIERLTDGDVPLVYWVGYSNAVLVGADYVSNWTVIVSEEPISRVLPRRWLSIGGRKIPDYWQAALRAAMALVIFRPGISQAEIRWRLRAVYDRQEVDEVLSHLRAEGFLTRRVNGDCQAAWIEFPADNQEEHSVFWFLGDKCWFQV